MNSKSLWIFTGFLFLATATAIPQKLSFKGQVSAFHLTKIGSPWVSANGLRYLPELKFSVPVKNDWKFDAEASVNADGRLNFTCGDTLHGSVTLKPYRVWGRFSSERFELRAGLQKINFGSASMLRPLMWFDHMDPRDPLQLTDGVYGVLGRYFFQGNANIWLWGILPGKTPKGWEMLASDRKMPEFGGRFQLPAGKGEIALSGHFRQIGTSQSRSVLPVALENPVPEYRIGLDGKWDIGPGIWFEGTGTWSDLPVADLKHLSMLTVGTDYTFGLGNGLTAMVEQFFYLSGPGVFQSTKTLTFTATSLTYPINLAHSLSAMIFYNWATDDWYRFVNWGISLSNISLYVMAFWNPDQFDLYQNTGNSSLMGGKGFQLMFVWNH